MPSVVSKTNHSAAKLAATTGKPLHADPESISLPYAQTAEMRRKYRLSQKPTDLFTAVTASQKQEKNKVAGAVIHDRPPDNR